MPRPARRNGATIPRSSCDKDRQHQTCRGVSYYADAADCRRPALRDARLPADLRCAADRARRRQRAGLPRLRRGRARSTSGPACPIRSRAPTTRPRPPLITRRQDHRRRRGQRQLFDAASRPASSAPSTSTPARWSGTGIPAIRTRPTPLPAGADLHGQLAQQLVDRRAPTRRSA